MAKRREKSEWEMYHVVLRGVNRQQIFENETDYWYFTEILRKYREICDYKLHAYCLMGNHVHLLIEAANEPIGNCMKRIEDSYVRYYNDKYDRTGHLFSNRFLSEPVEDLAYFMNAYRYILQNPVNAGMCESIFEYKWSSAKLIRKDDNGLTDNGRIKGEFANTVDIMKFMIKQEEGEFLEFDNVPSIEGRVPDSRARKIIHEVTGCKSVADFQRIDIAERNEYLRQILERRVSPNQVARLTGLSRYQVLKFSKC